MKLSYNWLNDFVDLSDLKLEDLAEKLTMGAFEVEEVVATNEQLGDDVVLAKILQIDKHPDADKLQVTQTCIGKNEDGSENVQQIVCGASNIEVGQLVPVATVGSCVTNRHDGSELKIKKSKIRGVESHGMLCSPDELGLDEVAIKTIKEKQGDGIYILNEITEADLGTPIAEVFNQEQDFVLDVGARANRGDALSVFGQAREIAALTNKPLKRLDLDWDSLVKRFDYDEALSSVEPKIADTNDCELFYTVAIEGIEIKESPQWLQDRINAMGTKAINNVVDISNYVLLEQGQPMHFYDREKISGGFLEVRRAKAGEEIETLEEKTHELEDLNLVIADKKGPSSLAGVMGGMQSSINDDTQNIVIEVAVFNPAVVRRSSRVAGVESESKRRFERGVDKANSKLALLRAIELLADLACPEGAKLKIGKIQLAGSEEIKEQSVSLKLDQVKRLLGIEIAADQIVSLLGNLELKLIKQSKDSLEFSVPSFRQSDISREADLIEEIGRLYGYDQIPAQRPGSCVTKIKAEKNNNPAEDRKIKARVREAFVAAGFSEAQLSSLIGDSLIGIDSLSKELINLHQKKSPGAQERINMDNPLSREHRVLRQSMLPGLIQAASRNYAYDKTIDVRLFELGKVYHYAGELSAEIDRDKAIEVPKLASIFVVNEADWTQAKSKTLAENFFFFKSIIENLYPRAKFNSLEQQAKTDSGLQLAHPGISAIVEQDRRIIGSISKLHPSLAAEWDLPDEVYVMELDLPNLKSIKFKPIASTPIVERDITVDGDDEISAAQIQDLMQKTASKDLQAINLVGLYRRDPEKAKEQGLPAKSTSFRLKYQSATETLSGEAIDAEVAKIKEELAKTLSVSFRD